MARQTGITNVINKSTVELTGMLGSIIYKNRPLGAVMADDPRTFIPENVTMEMNGFLVVLIEKSNIFPLLQCDPKFTLNVP